MTTGLCVMPHRDDEQEQAEPGWFICLHHRKRMTSLIADIRDLWVDTAFIIEAGTAPKDETPKTRHLKAAEAPAPANLEVLSLRDNRTRYGTITPTLENPDGDSSTPLPPVMEMIASWVLLVAEERPLSRDLLPRSTIAHLNLLLRHGDWIAAQPWVDDFLGEMTDLRKTLAGAVRDHTHRRIGSCMLPLDDGSEGLCGGTLIQENGSDVIRCKACGAAWTTPRERAMLAISLESA